MHIGHFIEPRMHNNMTNKAHLSTMHRKLLKRELFKYLWICGNSTGNPPTTPGGMMVCPVSMDTTLSMLEAPSKLWAAIFHISSPQQMGMRLHAPSVEAIWLRNTLWDYALEVLLISKELKKEGRNVVSWDIDCSRKRCIYANSVNSRATIQK